MKIWKLVSGILSIIFAIIIIGQSFLSSVLEAFFVGGYSSIAGLFTAILLLSSGIVSIATWKGSIGGSIASAILYVIAAIISFPASKGVFKDLIVWGGWSAICGSVLLVGLLLKPSARVACAYFYRLLMHPVFLAGCGCAMFLSGMTGTLFPLIVYCIGYPFVIYAIEHREALGIQENKKENVLQEQFNASSIPQEVSVKELPDAETTIYNAIIIIGTAALIFVIAFAIYRANT